MGRVFTLFAMFAALLLCAQNTNAQYTKLLDFTGNAGQYPGYYPENTALLSDGTFLYGMTSGGGTNGAGNIFKIKIADGSFTNLYDFQKEVGHPPVGSLVSDGNYLYGVTSIGGSASVGTVFKLKIADNSFTKIHDFSGTDGAYPTGSLVSDGIYLYGTTSNGGTTDQGAIFKIKIADNSFTKIHDFNGTDGSNLFGSLISDGSYLYGMASKGGINDKGTIFKIKIADNSFTKIHDFSGTDGARPTGSLVSDGIYLYGTTSKGGINDKGTIFKITIADNSFTKLYDFGGTDGDMPLCSLVSDGSYLYGMTSNGGTTDQGTIFKIKKADNSFTKLHDFSGTDGAHPNGSLTIVGGSLYGMTAEGGTGSGVVFKYQYLSIHPDASGNLFVDSAAAPGGDGSSWATALPQLADALKAAGEINTATPATVKQIWVTSGTYYPLYTPGPNMTDRDKTFMIPNGVLILGGYTGTETDAMQHSPATGRGTILSGDIGVRGNPSDNAYHVLTAVGDSLGSVLSGGCILGWMTITGGNANGTSSIQIKGQTIHQNEGGGLVSRHGRPMLGNCLFINNYAVNGAAIMNYYDYGAITNCTLVNNADAVGKAIYNYDDGIGFQLGVLNSIVMNGIRSVGPQPIVKYSLVQGMAADATNHNPDGSINPGFINPSAGNYHLAANSPAVDAGDNGATGFSYDLAGYPRIYDSANGGIIDMGAYEYQGNPVHPDANGIIYVDSAAAPGGDGSSWATALQFFDAALNAADKQDAVLQIWVAGGTYQPTVGQSFYILDSLKIYGGFAGTESSLSQRNLTQDGLSILKGNGATVIINENETTGRVVMDGFQVTGGNINGSGAGLGQVAEAEMIVSNSIFYGNTAGIQGAAILNEDGTLTVINSLFYNNVAGYGGALCSTYGSNPLTIINCTFVHNEAEHGGAVYAYSHINIFNSVFFENTTTVGAPGYNSDVEGYDPDYISVNHTLMTGGYAGTGNLDQAPQFVDIPGNDFRLQIGSPAIDAGTNDPFAPGGAAEGIEGDLVGNPRIYNAANGGIIDMGAYEYQGNQIHPDANGIVYVDSASAPGGDGSSWATALPQLADALKAAEEINHSAPGTVKQIWVASGTYYPLYTPEANMADRDKTFLLVKNVAVLGGFAGTETDVNQRSPITGRGTVLSGDIGVADNTSDNAYHVVAALGSTTDTSLNDVYALADVAITGGNAKGSSAAQIKGRPVWRNQGGGIESDYANMRISNCLFVKNRAVNGAALMNAHGNGATVVTNCTMVDNPDNSGYAIFNFNTGAALQVKNSILMDSIRHTGVVPVVEYSLVKGMAANATNHNLDGNTNPYFKNAAAGDYRLALNSLAVNAGNNSLSSGSTDLANNPRIFGAAIDLGAYELQRTPPTPGTGNILYVDQNISGGNGSGDSWANAIPELADALKWARQQHDADSNWLQNDRLRIFIAKGTYKPLYSAADGVYTNDSTRDNAFVMVKNVQLYGGFPSGGSTLANRNWAVNPTILSGDIGTAGDSTDNTYHVVVSAGDVGNAALNGLTISGGNADGENDIFINGIQFFQYYGGGMFNYSSSPSISNTTISNNSAKFDGGMYNNFSSPTILNTTISNNSAKYGSGMGNYYSSPTVLNTTISNNSAEEAGGGMYNTYSSPIILNTIISNNSARYGSGMGNFESSSLTILNSTISNNSASYGGGIYNYYSSSLVVNNSIVFGNRLADASVSNISNIGSAPVIKYSLVGGATTWNTGWGTDGGNNIVTNTNPFVDTAKGDFSLVSNSAAINAGSDSLYTAVGGDSVNDLDLAGNARVYNQSGSGIIDMGAYEFQGNATQTIQPDTNGIVYVDSAIAVSGDGSSWTNAVKEVADALKWARQQHDADSNWLQNDSLRIFIAKGTYKPLYNAADGSYTTVGGRDNAFVMVKNVQLYGGFPSGGSTFANRNWTTNRTILSGDIGTANDSTDNTYHVVISAGDVGNAGLNALIIAEGNAKGNTNGVGYITVNGLLFSRSNGGGMNNNSSSPQLVNVSVVGNSAYNGGGVYNASSSPQLVNVSIMGNSATTGGGMLNGISSPQLVNVSIVGNSANDGGGMYNANSSPQLVNVSIVGNSANDGGGMLNIGNSNTTLYNSIVWGSMINSAGDTFTAQYSLIEGSSSSANGNIDATGLSDTDIFNDPANGNYNLNNSSAAINAGSNALYTNAGGDLVNDLDLAGNPRLYGDSVDMGAYELQDDPIPPDGNGIIYVDSAAAPGGDGSSWATAVSQLSEALYYARANAASWVSDSLRIYVAKGTYLPEYRADNNLRAVNDRNVAFVMVKNVQLYGGYPHGGGARNPAANPTILSGDIGTINDAADNTYHVVISAGDAGKALLNGFTIAKGNANGNHFAQITINGQSISAYRGGGMYNAVSSPKLTNMIISNNSATNGGGMFNYVSSPAIVNTRVSNNSAQLYGGGMFNDQSSPAFLNTTISNNSASYGGGMYNANSFPAILNSIVFGNKPTDLNGFNIFNNVSTPVFKNSLVAGVAPWRSNWGTDGGNNFITTTNPFTDTASGDFSLIPGPAVEGGSNMLYTDAGGDLANDKDLAGNARLFRDSIDMGAYESQNIAADSTKITLQPKDSTVCEGDAASFSVSTTGSNISYQWQQLSTDNGAVWTNVSAATTATLTISNTTSADSGTQYRSIVAGDRGKDTSASATLHVNAPVLISLQPHDTSLLAGESATFSIAATGTVTGYQWQVSSDGTNWNIITGETNPTLNLSNSAISLNGHQYRAIVTGNCNSDTSALATLMVNQPVLTLDPAALPAGYANVLYPAVTFSASGGTEPYTYTETGALPDGMTFADGILSGTPSESGSFPISITAEDHSATNVGGPFLTTKSYTLVINTGGSCITITSYPANQTVCEGGNASFSISATGATGYQWQSSVNGGNNWTDINNETNATLSLTDVVFSETPAQYRVIVKSDCGDITSGPATLTVNANAAITIQPTDATVCETGNTSFSVTATGANLTYQWQSSMDGTNWGNITGGTTATLNVSNVQSSDNGTEYHVIVNSDCGNVTSGPATLTVRTNAAITTQPQDVTASEGGNATFSVVAVGAVSYQWKSSADGNIWKVLNGETTTSLQLSNISVSAEGTKYMVVVTGACGVVSSAIATLSVTANPVITLSPGTLPDATIGTAFSATVTAGGGTAPYNYQLTGNLPTGISFNATTGKLSGTPTEAGTFNNITIQATGKNNFSGSQNYMLTANPPTMALSPASLSSGFAGIQYSQTITANGGTAPYTYAVSGTLPTNITLDAATGVLSGITNETGTFNNIQITATDASTGTGAPFTVSKTYTLVINSGGSCITITSAPQNQAVCEGSDAAFSIAATGAKGYQWESSIDGGNNWQTITGATGSTLSLTDVQFSETPVQYHVMVHSSCGDITSGSAMLTVNAIKHTTLNETICFGSAYNFGGKNILQSGIYYDTLSAATGCDSVVVLNLTVRPEIKTTLNKTICFGGVYPFGGTNIAQSGMYYDTLQAVTGCDSVVVLNLTVRSEIKTTLNKTICFGEVYPFGGENISQSGTYYDTLQAATGCDSVVVLKLTVRPEVKTLLTKTICAGSSYVFGGVTISESGTYHKVLRAATGCDSVVELHLTVRPEIKTTLNKTICANSVYDFNGLSLTESGAYSDILTSYTGCDSIVVLNLTVRTEIKTTLNKIICYGGVYSFGGENISQSGTYSDTLTSYTGCDSIVVLDLTVRPEIRTTLNKMICANSVYNFGGENIAQSGTYSDTLTSYTGCDSVVVLNLTVRPEIKTALNETICEGDIYTVGSHHYSEPGTYADTLRSVTGCDSIVTLHLTVNAKTRITLQPVNVTVCDGGEVTFSVTATGTKVTYQWQSSTNAGTWHNIEEATGKVLQIADIPLAGNGTKYHVIVSGTCGEIISKNVTLKVNPLPDITITPDSTNPVSKGILTRLRASGADSYRWDPSAGILTGQHSAVLQVRPMSDATYTVTGTTTEGCSAQQSYDVQVVDDYKLESNNILTPNGDGKNDTWNISNIEAYPENEVFIYDRSGRLVFHEKNYRNGWDGKLNGNPLNTGTYYYIVNVRDGKKVFKGYITIVQDIY